MLTVNDEAVGPLLPGRWAGPHERCDHERLVLEARDVEFDGSKLHCVPGEPFTTSWLIERVSMAAAIEHYLPQFHPAQQGGVERAVDYLAVSPAARASH